MTDMIHHKSDNTSLSFNKKEVVKGGFIKFYRDFQDWHWYSDANVLQLYIHLMLTANFKDKPFKDIIVHRGEVVISHMRLSLSKKHCFCTKHYMASRCRCNINTCCYCIFYLVLWC